MELVKTFDEVSVEVFGGLEERGKLAAVLVERPAVSDIRIHVLLQVLFDKPVQVITVLLQVGLPLLEETFSHF